MNRLMFLKSLLALVLAPKLLKEDISKKRYDDFIRKYPLTPKEAFRYQWYLNGAPIAGATGPSYILGPNDIGDLTLNIEPA